MGSIVVNESAFGSPQTPIAFSHRVINSGTHTCIANAVQTVVAFGCLATDIAFVFRTDISNAEFVYRVLPATNQLTVTMSGNPTIGGRLSWIVLRAC